MKIDWQRRAEVWCESFLDMMAQRNDARSWARNYKRKYEAALEFIEAYDERKKYLEKMLDRAYGMIWIDKNEE